MDKYYADRIKTKQRELCHHPVYKKLNNLNSLKVFMEHHVFAVWDFMTLLKSIQRKVTCVEVPWRPSPFPNEVVRHINEIVLGEESDLNHFGAPQDHFSLYLTAMNEVRADTTLISAFLKDFDLNLLSGTKKDFVRFHLDTAIEGDLIETVAVFLYGRETLIGDMFSEIVREFKNYEENYQALLYYFKRHIEVDSGEHSVMANKVFHILCDQKDRDVLQCMAYDAASKALDMRMALWDSALREIEEKERKSL